MHFKYIEVVFIVVLVVDGGRACSILTLRNTSLERETRRSLGLLYRA